MLPITLIVLVLSMTITPMPVGTLVLFLAGAVLLIVGMAFFSLGTDVSMTPMGEGIGAQLPKTKNLAVVIAITLLIGILITIAEPDLQVLAGQVPSIPNSMLIWTVAVGVGLFFVLALLRTIFKIRLSLLLILFYIAVFIFSAFVPNEFVSVAFDSGGVTTGPITVPFIMALGVGLASIRGDSDAQDDSFGLVALCSIGPVACGPAARHFLFGRRCWLYADRSSEARGHPPGRSGICPCAAGLHTRGRFRPAAGHCILCDISADL